MPMPKANPSDTSWSTNSYQTKSSSPAASAALKASTAGSARPSFIPDSRLSECRTSRGTRGLVTTLEDSTGSVGDSSAPSRNDSVHVRSVTACVTSATSTHVIGIARISLRAGQPPLALEHLALDLDPVAEQDHDQGDGRELDDEARLGVELEHAEPAVAEHEARHHEDRGHRQEAAVRQPGRERTDDQQRAEDERGDLELFHPRNTLP